MKLSRTLVAVGAAVAAASLSTVGIASASTPSAAPQARHAANVCAAPAKGYAACHAKVIVDSKG